MHGTSVADVLPFRAHARLPWAGFAGKSPVWFSGCCAFLLSIEREGSNGVGRWPMAPLGA